MDECITGLEQSSKYKMEINALSHKLSDKKIILRLNTKHRDLQIANQFPGSKILQLIV